MDLYYIHYIIIHTPEIVRSKSIIESANVVYISIVPQNNLNSTMSETESTQAEGTSYCETIESL